VAQSILALARRLDAMLSDNGHKAPKTYAAQLEDMHIMANDAYKSVQRYARDLRPSILDQMGLTAALNWLADELSKDLGIRAEVRAGKLPALASEMELAMFRIAQEALNNVRRHSHSSEVKISVVSTPSNLKMTIIDNGVGFSISRLNANLAKDGKLGVLGMSERARLIGGNLQILSEPGKGTTVVAEAPLM